MKEALCAIGVGAFLWLLLAVWQLFGRQTERRQGTITPEGKCRMGT